MFEYNMFYKRPVGIISSRVGNPWFPARGSKLPQGEVNSPYHPSFQFTRRLLTASRIQKREFSHRHGKTPIKPKEDDKHLLSDVERKEAFQTGFLVGVYTSLGACILGFWLGMKSA